MFSENVSCQLPATFFWMRLFFPFMSKRAMRAATQKHMASLIFRHITNGRELHTMQRHMTSSLTHTYILGRATWRWLPGLAEVHQGHVVMRSNQSWSARCERHSECIRKRAARALWILLCDATCNIASFDKVFAELMRFKLPRSTTLKQP